MKVLPTAVVILSWLLCPPAKAAKPSQLAKPYLLTVDANTHIVGNSIWNVTIVRGFGRKLYYKNTELVGRSSGHYVSYNGAANNLSWNYRPPRILRETDTHTNIMFSAPEGDFHWVLTPELHGAYQYFVNRALPVLGEFRTLWRLDNRTFTHGWTVERDEPLVTFADVVAAKPVKDGTLQRANGSYITKYDLSTFMANTEGNSTLLYWGVYGVMPSTRQGIGSWYIHAGKDYLNGDHLKQELMVHREGSTGDTVQLNMLHGNHYQAGGSDNFLPGKTWGPWLWYLNNGSASDAKEIAKQETTAWPYTWFQDLPGHHSRGSISGTIILSDGRPASGAAIFLGENHSNKTTLDQGASYNYRTYADDTGTFKISNIREGLYALHAWPNGGKIGDVTTVFLRNDVKITSNLETQVKGMNWTTQGRKQIWQIGTLDRKASEFKFAGPPHEHARAAMRCAANATYTIGKHTAGDWCFAQGDVGVWTIRFSLSSLPDTLAPAGVLSVSLAEFSSVVSSTILVNNSPVGSLSTPRLRPDSSLPRSGTVAGEWKYIEFPIQSGILRKGDNVLDFKISKNDQWRGYMFDTVLMEWK